MTELNLVSRLTGRHGDWKRDLQNLVPFVPVDLRCESQHTALERDRLGDGRAAEPPPDHHVRIAVLDVQVPGVPAPRVVVVKLEHVAAAPQHLTAGLLVPDRGDGALLAELDAKEVVFERAVTRRRRTRHGLSPAHLHRHECNRLGVCAHRVELALGLFVDPVDRRARQVLRLGLAGVGAAVQLEVQLAADDREVTSLGRGTVEEVDGLADGHAERMRGLDHLGGRAAAAVAVAEQVQGLVRGRRVLEVAHAVLDLFGREVAVVGVCRRKVREHSRAVDTFPPERVVLRLVGVVPGKLLGQEVVAPRLLDQLGEVAGISEDVRQPQDARLVAELLHEVALAVQKLAHQRLAGRQVAVGLHPHRADRLPLAGRRLRLDPPVQVRVRLLHPFVLRGLRAGENEVGILVH